MDPSEYPVTLGAQFKRNLHLYSAGTLLLFLQQVFMAKRDFLVKAAVDSKTGGVAEQVTQAAIGILVVSIIAAGARVLSRITIFTGGRNVEYELRAALLAHLHKLGPAFFRRMPTGEIMSRATNDLAQVRLLLGFGLLNVAGALFGLVSALYVMVMMSPKLTLASLLTFPLLMFVTRSFSTRLFKYNRENQEAIGHMSDRVLASLSGVRVVRSFALEATELKSFAESNEEYLHKSLNLAKVRGLMAPVMGVISAASVLIVFWYGGYLVIGGEMTEGDFVSFWLAMLRLTWPMLAIGFVAAVVQRGRAGYARLKVIFEATPDIVSGSLPAPEVVHGELTVRGLSFKHGDRTVVDHVSFDVPAGTSLAIVGRTGSGKTSIATLLPRLMPTPPGTVFLDGKDICDLPLETVRASIGYAQQDAFLFSTTVTRNVGYALPDADSPEAAKLIEQAASEASVLPEIRSLPEGFDTVVGERGVQLSGGQRQRIALARALLREPPILVLDDPLSAVDAKTEAAILEAIDRQAKKRTVLLITHRVAAARRCTSIIVLERGKIIERGTHDELVELGGLYAAFAEEQQIEADLAALDVDTSIAAEPTHTPAPSPR